MNIKCVVFSALLAAPFAAIADSPDSDFYVQAAQSGMFEVDASFMAEDKGANPEVKRFASMVVKDRAGANLQLRNMGTAKGVELPHATNAQQKVTETSLDKLTGANFDKAFLQAQISSHQQTIDLFEKEAASGHDLQAKAFAKANLPVLQRTVKAATDLAGSMGVSLD
jgi:putative membrane protein